ncbi:concanavalin A-like lectin/glucanase domain-containing protein [Coniochaeta sp. 2T2.1]|nr:concanavalin A-like lectin/glucanase domain-containing protein [Coniochaeta sp. 2T2.1]
MLALALSLVLLPHALLASTIIIPSASFSSPTAFNTSWSPNYPWGTDHNGSARMSPLQISLSNSTLTLTATPATGQPPASHGGKSIPIHYISGAIHAKSHFTVSPSGGYDFSAEFVAPVTRGTWPAFWLTYVDGWPPEVDLAEWKGSGKVSFNTFNTSSQVAAKDVVYERPGEWHSVKAELRALGNGKDVGVKFWLDGRLVTTQVGRGYVGKAMYLIINLQMEGSSGSPGPSGDTLYQIRNVEVVSYNP